MEQLVIGKGQIGTAIQAVLNCQAVDKELSAAKHKDVIHVCIPYNEDFDTSMKKFIELYTPDLIVIHSTVPVGTSEKYDAVHSPVRGRHPNLEPGVRTFVKFFGGPRALDAARLFVFQGIHIETTPLARTTEAMKLWDTTQYLVNIQLEKLIHQFCEEHGCDFNIVYTEANKTYNEGYKQLGEPQFTKYILEHQEGPVGGHCCLPNNEILKQFGYAVRLDTC